MVGKAGLVSCDREAGRWLSLYTVSSLPLLLPPPELLRNVTPPVYFKLSPQGSGTLASAQCDLGQHSSHDNESYWRQTGALGVLRGQDSSLLARLSSGQLKGTPDSRHLLLFFSIAFFLQCPGLPRTRSHPFTSASLLNAGIIGTYNHLKICSVLRA